MATTVAESSTSVPSDVTETTFTKYTAKEANIYNDLRPNYHSSVYDHILNYHKSTGGRFDALVDVGCGPGMVTRSLAPHFVKATGIDPSPELLKVADEHVSCAPVQFAGTSLLIQMIA
jgi:trans-aconitate 3-methyltransferase